MERMVHRTELKSHLYLLEWLGKWIILLNLSKPEDSSSVGGTPRGLWREERLIERMGPGHLLVHMSCSLNVSRCPTPSLCHSASPILILASLFLMPGTCSEALTSFFDEHFGSRTPQSSHTLTDADKQPLMFMKISPSLAWGHTVPQPVFFSL